MLEKKQMLFMCVVGNKKHVDGAGWKESKLVWFPSFKWETNAWLLEGGRQQIGQENCFMPVTMTGDTNSKTTIFLELLKNIKYEIRVLFFFIPLHSLIYFILQILMNTGQRKTSFFNFQTLCACFATLMEVSGCGKKYI